MSYNHDLTERVRQALAQVQQVEEKPMFGSIGFMVNGKLCLGVGDHEDHVLLVRVGSKMYDEALKRRGAGPAIMRGKEHKGYVFLQSEAVETEEDLRYWVQLALDFNQSLNA